MCRPPAAPFWRVPTTRWRMCWCLRRTSISVHLRLLVRSPPPALARWPTSESAILAAANADLRLSLHTRALALAREGLAHHPDSTALRAVLGRALLGLNNPQQASEAFKAVLALKPSSAYYHYLMSVALWHLSHPDQARMQLEVALSIEPTNPDYLALSAQYERQRNPSRAVQVLRTALRLQPQAVSSQVSRLPLVGGMGAGWLLCALVSLGGAPFAGASALVWAFNALVALRLSATQPLAWLAGFCGVHAVLLNASNTTGGCPCCCAPRAWVPCWGLKPCSLPLAPASWFFAWWCSPRWCGGCCGAAWFKPGPPPASCGTPGATAAPACWRAKCCAAPGVQFNLIAGTCLGLSASPLVPLHLAMLTQVFVLPSVLCVLGWLRLPKGARPPLPVVFFMLGFMPAMVTMAGTSLLAEPVAAADQWEQHWKHWAYALALGLYGAMLAQQAQTP
jgi:Tetratricopeptide repeat